jgi:hypothetical protein
MNIIFSYEIERDVQNFIASTQSVNSSQSTELCLKYIEEYGSAFDESTVKFFIEKYLQSKQVDISAVLNKIESKWRILEESFVLRCENLFGLSYPKDRITAYLTTNQRCTYNISEGYFFLTLGSENTHAIIMHELFHFYTYEAFHKNLMEQGVSASQYNDIKESLTELLNSEFADLMGISIDRGYIQHKNMRQFIREFWEKDKDLNRLVGELILYSYEK